MINLAIIRRRCNRRSWPAKGIHVVGIYRRGNTIRIMKSERWNINSLRIWTSAVLWAKHNTLITLLPLCCDPHPLQSVWWGLRPVNYMMNIPVNKCEILKITYIGE